MSVFLRLSRNNVLTQFIRRRWCFKVRKRKLLCTILVMPLAIVILAPIIFYYYFFRCSYLEVTKAKDTICEAYFNKQAFGNLCYQFCQNRSLIPQSCITNHLGKDVVFNALYNNRSVIIKTSNLNTNDLDPVFWTNGTNHVFFPTLDRFYDMMHNSVMRNLNLSKNDVVAHGKALLNFMWSVNVQNFKLFPKSQQNAIMNNVWFLIQQPEYLLLKYHGSKDLFPQIIGTCGHFYVEEFVQPLGSWFTVMYPNWKETFAKRVELALKIIQYVENVEVNLPKLQVCDVKVGHFGLNSDGHVKLLDMDMVFYEPALIQNIVAIPNCTRDDDCSFIDCQGSCDTALHECKPIVVNNNFQRVCTNIFAGKFVQKYFGLLGHPPAELSLILPSLLQQCFGKMNSSIAKNLKEELKTLLKNFVNLKHI